MDDFDKILQASKLYAESQGYELNANPKELERIINGLLENERRYSARYCPCRAVTGNRREDAKIICPCIYHINEINEMGHCRCRLFFSKKPRE